MDNLENTSGQDTVVFENDQPLPYAVKKKKTSPFANSPYVSPFTEAEASEPIFTPPVVQRKTKDSAGKRIVSTLLVFALVLSGCAITAAVVNSRWEQEMALMSEATKNRLNVMQQQINEALEDSGADAVPGLPEGAMTPAQVYDKCADAVISVNSTVQTVVNGQTQTAMYSGSGFIITADGYIVTNYHIVENAKTVTITLPNNAKYVARVIGYEAANDIALLKVQATDLPFVQLGSSSKLQVGDQVVAIGNPLGHLTSTLTVGYISAKDRLISIDGTSIKMLQTDTAINAGNSGGPLFNMYGQVVGINTAKYYTSSTSSAPIESIGFAIPVDDVAGMLDDLQKFGYITGAYLGVMVRDVYDFAQAYGLPVGAFVTEVSKGHAAEKAGVQANDIIVNIGGYDITCISDISRALRRFKAGDTTTITVYRNNRELNLSITLDAKPQTTTGSVTPEDAPEEGDFNEWYEFFKKFFGID